MVIIILVLISQGKSNKEGLIKIGVVTDLSGGAAYWGESTRAGVDILQKELNAQGKNINFIVEDTSFDAAKSASAAQKLVNVDKVNAVYAELNPIVIAVASVLKNMKIPLSYTAAITSPLQSNGLFYKSYLDYQKGCKQIAEKFKNEGVTKMGVLKVNMEFGELCLAGVKEVYGANMSYEAYNLGDTDFKTQLLKIKNSGAQAVINAGFEADTSNTLKVIKDYKYKLLYGAPEDTFTANTLAVYKEEIKGAWTFGLGGLSPEFQAKLAPYKVSSPYGAAFAYTHLKELVSTIEKCGSDTDCITKTMDASPADPTIGFEGYQNHIANLVMTYKKY